MFATGSNGERFAEADIANSEKRDRMRSMVLRNDNGDVVVVVDHPTKKHFRVLGGAFGERVVAREVDTDPTHNQCVNYILKFLRANCSDFKIVSWLFVGDTEINTNTGRPKLKRGEPFKLEKQVVVQPLSGATYHWFQGPAARLRFKDQRYIEPDIVGRPMNSMQPSGSCPGLIVEVIRTHPPNPETFERLFEMSKVAHFVIFYVIPTASVEAQANRVWPANSTLEVSASFYLLNGKFYERGVHIPPTGSNAETRYAQYVKGVLATAMLEAKAI